MKDKKNKRLRLFDITKDGRGISKKEKLSESGIKRFFLTAKNNFGKLVYVNMFMVLGNFPLLFLIITLSGYTKYESYTPLADIFQNLSGIFMIESRDPAMMSIYALEGLQAPLLVNSALTYVFYGISALTLFTFGIVNVGTAYILRNIAMGEPVFVWSDFWYAVKRNFKLAIPFGIIDGLIHCILIFNLYSTISGVSNFLMSMMFWANIILFVIYFFMRPYVYVQMVTFDLSLFKIIKNSLIFTLLGLKRNILAFLGCLAFIVLEVLFLFSSAGILLPLAIAAPLAIMFSLMAYMKIYAAYFKIKEVIIDPYKQEHPEIYENQDDDADVIMQDDVTERERLEEIKKKNKIN